MHIGFWLVNFLPPGTPEEFELRTPAGKWTFAKSPYFFDCLDAVTNKNACANTYSMMFPLPNDVTQEAVKQAAFLEALPICLGASFTTGTAVTIRNSLDGSEIQFFVVGPRFPRQRELTGVASCLNTMDQLIVFLERFVAEFNTLNSTEKLLLLSHFYIDALSCWSLEDLYLSGSTLLQIIASTEEDSGRPFAATHAAERAAGNKKIKPGFFDYLAGAANRVGIAPLGHDVVKIRNSLIHDGTLKGPKFPTQADSAKPIAEAMLWVDAYVYAVLKLGQVPVLRHAARNYTIRLNSFSF
jgi:hypothetical protein